MNDRPYCRLVRTSLRGKIKCVLENLETGERRLFRSEASASRFLGRSNAYLRSVRINCGALLTSKTGEEYIVVYPGLGGIEDELTEDADNA